MSCTFLILYLSAAALCPGGEGAVLWSCSRLSSPWRADCHVFGELGEWCPPLMCTLGITALVCPAELCRVNEFVLIQLFEDEKCHGRALLLLPRMKRSVRDPTVLCLATGCHSCSTHNAERKSAYPAMGSSSFQSLSLVCALLVC